MRYLDIEKFRSTKSESDPFEYIVVPGFLNVDCLADVNADYPDIKKAGNFQLQHLTSGPHFQGMIEEIKSPEFLKAIEEKFTIDLHGLECLVSVRAISDKIDGNIHNDAPSKVMTALIYLNEDWNSSGGRLRLLRNQHDIEDYVAEVPPVSGTLLLFKRSDNSWHGHKQFVGPRRTIQINWRSDHRPIGLKRIVKNLLRLRTH